MAYREILEVDEAFVPKSPGCWQIHRDPRTPLFSVVINVDKSQKSAGIVGFKIDIAAAFKTPSKFGLEDALADFTDKQKLKNFSVSF